MAVPVVGAGTIPVSCVRLWQGRNEDVQFPFVNKVLTSAASKYQNLNISNLHQQYSICWARDCGCLAPSLLAYLDVVRLGGEWLGSSTPVWPHIHQSLLVELAAPGSSSCQYDIIQLIVNIIINYTHNSSIQHTSIYHNLITPPSWTDIYRL